jgi:hypothetical protein
MVAAPAYGVLSVNMTDSTRSACLPGPVATAGRRSRLAEKHQRSSTLLPYMALRGLGVASFFELIFPVRSFPVTMIESQDWRL